MRHVTVTIQGTATYSASRMHDEPALPKEDKDAYDQRTWRSKLNVDANGNGYIPAMAFKQALSVSARRLGTQVPGRGKSTFTKYFEADVICLTDMLLGVHRDTVDMIKISANVTGIRGSGKRVPRRFPVIHEWGGKVSFTILDNTVTREVFEDVMITAGTSVGVGRFRPENGGLNGRWKCLAFDWAD